MNEHIQEYEDTEKFRQQWKDLRTLADELGLKLCYADNYAVLSMMVKHKSNEEEEVQPTTTESPKPTNMIGLIFRWYEQLSDIGKTIVAVTIGSVGIALLYYGKINNLF